MVVLQLITLLSLIFILYQDIRYRAVYWLCFPATAILLGILKVSQTSFSVFLTDMSYSMVFLLVQLLLLSAYFSIKNKAWINLTKAHLGWGDILFLFAIAFYFSPINFVLFYIISLILVLLFVVVQILSLKEKSSKYIPLAGLQAALFGLVLIGGLLFREVSFVDDQWVYFLMYSSAHG